MHVITRCLFSKGKAVEIRINWGEGDFFMEMDVYTGQGIDGAAKQN